MKYCNIILFLTLSSWVFMQECPPSDTLSIDPIQNMWNIPMENNWDEIEVMTWNIKQFPLSSNTIAYVNEIGSSELFLPGKASEIDEVRSHRISLLIVILIIFLKKFLVTFDDNLIFFQTLIAERVLL